MSAEDTSPRKSGGGPADLFASRAVSAKSSVDALESDTEEDILFSTSAWRRQNVKSRAGGSPRKAGHSMSLSRTAPHTRSSQADDATETSEPCGECDRAGALAWHYCPTCSLHLCAACSDQHSFSKRTRSHMLLSRTEWRLSCLIREQSGGGAGGRREEQADEGAVPPAQAVQGSSLDGAKQEAVTRSTAPSQGTGARKGDGGRRRRQPSWDNVQHHAGGHPSLRSSEGRAAMVITSPQSPARCDLLWRLMADCLPADKETIQREIVRHVEFTLACTRLSFERKHAFQAAAHSLRDRLVERFNDTDQNFNESGARRIYYLSLEFLMGRALCNSVYSLGLAGAYREALLDLGFRLEDLYEEENDAALGNGGLGRLAACFMDSLATLNFAACGYGLRYSYGLFEQRIMNNGQIELPDSWLTEGNPWEIERLDVQYTIRFYGKVEHMQQKSSASRPGRADSLGFAPADTQDPSRPPQAHSSFLTHTVMAAQGDGGAGGRGEQGGGGGSELGVRQHRAVWEGGDLVQAVAYDTLVPGHGTRNTLNLRLWASRPTKELELDMALFQLGDYQGALDARQKSENITSVLYPSDSSYSGKELRLKQQYFLVAASMQDILARYKKSNLGGGVMEVHQHLVLQLNDTHPALAVVEWQRLLIDQEGLSWTAAWDITTQVFNYTNHTVLPEAMEKWTVSLMETVIPRHMELIWEINHRFLKLVRAQFPHDPTLPAALSIIEEPQPRPGEPGGEKLVRMAHLAVIGSRRVNGVAEMHTQILKDTLFHDFHRLWPDKFLNITNGVTPRRWLLQANPYLADLIEKLTTEGRARQGGAGGEAQDMQHVHLLRLVAGDPRAQQLWRAVRLRNKRRLAALIQETCGLHLDASTMLFDVQVKRIHEYKRQVLNLLGVIHRHSELRRMRREAPGLLGAVVPRAVILSGKAAPGYAMAKLVIKLIMHVAAVVNADKDTNSLLKVVFIPNYNVKMAETIIPAADVSQHLSTAGMEASGTGNIKFAMNGCLLLASLDGATAEICHEVGEDNLFIFGTRAHEVSAVRDRLKRGDAKVDARYLKALHRIREGDFGAADAFEPLLEALRPENDDYLVGADFGSYLEAQAKVDRIFTREEEWTKMSILCCAGMAAFSSDRCIHEYAARIWDVKPCPLDLEVRTDVNEEAC